MILLADVSSSTNDVQAPSHAGSLTMRHVVQDIRLRFAQAVRSGSVMIPLNSGASLI